MFDNIHLAAGVLIILILLLKFYINHEATPIDKKQMLLSFPSEITVWTIGAMLSGFMENSAISGGQIVKFLLSFIILVILYIMESKIKNKLGGKLGMAIIGNFAFMYILSILCYMLSYL